MLKHVPGNRIRDRLEALEALVENSNKGQAANSSKPPENATYRSNPDSDDQRLDQRSRRSSKDRSAILPSENSDTWDMGDLLNTATTHPESVYDFTATHSSTENYEPKPPSPFAEADHMSTRHCMHDSHSPLALASFRSNFVNRRVLTLEPLDETNENLEPSEEVNLPAHISSGSITPHTPNGSSGPCHPMNYGYPFTPMSVPMQPLNSGPLSRKSIIFRH